MVTLSFSVDCIISHGMVYGSPPVIMKQIVEVVPKPVVMKRIVEVVPRTDIMKRIVEVVPKPNMLKISKGLSKPILRDKLR